MATIIEQTELGFKKVKYLHKLHQKESIVARPNHQLPGICQLRSYQSCDKPPGGALMESNILKVLKPTWLSIVHKALDLILHLTCFLLLLGF